MTEALLNRIISLQTDSDLTAAARIADGRAYSRDRTIYWCSAGMH